MITLTTPPTINSILGGNAPVGYDKLVVGPFTFDPIAKVIQGTMRLTSTVSPDMQPLIGSLVVTPAQSLLEVSVERLDFYRRVQLTGPQNTAVQTIVSDAQNALESGLVAIGVVAGTQEAGA